MINSFDGKYRFLSNFYEKELIVRGKTYATSEHAYQAYKATNDGDHRLVQSQSSPRMAKRKGGEIECRKDWNEVKYDIMLEIVRVKFQDPYLKALLLDTGDEYLKEGNHWHDNTWGDCSCGKKEECLDKGKNWLGEILMKVRKEIKND